MFQRSKFWLAILLFSILTLLFSGCKVKTRPTPITLRVLSNLSSPYGNELDHRFIEFQTSNPRTASGRPIVVQTVEIGDYKDMLQKHIGTDTSVDFIILDSREDAEVSNYIMQQMQHSVNICAGVRACPTEVPAIIPSSIEGDTREAAEKLQEALQKAPA